MVRHAKGGKDRRTILPKTLVAPLERQLEEAKREHQRDLAAGYGAVSLPFALARKYVGAGLALAVSVSRFEAGR